MNIIFKIAKAELRTLFYSPIAWLVVFVFYITGAAVFSLGLKEATIWQDVMLQLKPNWEGFLGIGTQLTSTILSKVITHIYLFMPLLTMGIINREISNGTINLLYSSPVTTREIVLGKYVGMVIFNLLLLLIFAVIMVSVYMTVENVETGWYLSMMLGFFLLVNAYAAIGLFISSLTHYQIVAAMITFTVLFVLSIISGFWQQYDLIRDITWFLSIAGKADKIMAGLITSRDVIYFLLVILLFIGFAMIKMKGTQQRMKWTVAAARYTMLSLLVITLGFFSSRPGYIAYLDVTKAKRNTIHPATQAALKELDGSPLKVTLYTNLLDKYAYAGLPQARNNYIWNIWEKYIRFYPNTEFRFEYYYDQMDNDSSKYYEYPGKSLEEITAIEAEILGIRPSIFKDPATIRKQIDLSPENMHLIMQLECNGKKEWLRTYDDTRVWPDEHHFAAAFKRLTRDKDVRIGFVAGHYERNAFDFAPRNFGAHLTYKRERTTLINQGVDIDSLSLKEGPVPDNINLLVVADPRSEYNDTVKNRILDYIRKGGNAIFFAEPGKQFILDPLVSTIGIQLENGTIVRPDKHEMPHIFMNHLTKTGNYLAEEKWLVDYQKYGGEPGKLNNEGALSLGYKEMDGFKIEPVISMKGNDNTWIENGHLVVDSATPVFSTAENDQKKDAYTIGVKLTRQLGDHEQRILVLGDADMMTYARMNGSTMGHAFYSWGLQNKYPIYLNYPPFPDKFLKVNGTQADWITIIYLYTGSAVLLLGAIVLLVRRKRK